MDQRTTGLILRTRVLTETSLIANWLTPDLGRLSTVAKGARRPKSPFLGKLDLFYLADFTFQPNRRSDLHTLREVSVREHHQGLRADLGALQRACYFAQLIEQTTEANTPVPGLFELLLQVVHVLLGNRRSPLLVHAFEMKLLVELGLKPDLEDSSLTAGARSILDQLSTADWMVISCLRASPAQLEELDQFLHHFLIYHFGRVPKGRSQAVPAPV